MSKITFSRRFDGCISQIWAFVQCDFLHGADTSTKHGSNSIFILIFLFSFCVFSRRFLRFFFFLKKKLTPWLNVSYLEIDFLLHKYTFPKKKYVFIAPLTFKIFFFFFFPASSNPFVIGAVASDVIGSGWVSQVRRFLLLLLLLLLFFHNFLEKSALWFLDLTMRERPLSGVLPICLDRWCRESTITVRFFFFCFFGGGGGNIEETLKIVHQDTQMLDGCFTKILGVDLVTNFKRSLQLGGFHKQN